MSDAFSPDDGWSDQDHGIRVRPTPQASGPLQGTDDLSVAPPGAVTLTPVDHKPKFETKIKLEPVDYTPDFVPVDTGQNVPESPETLAYQQRLLMEGKRGAQMFPTGTDELPIPAGFARTETDRGVYHYDPAQYDAATIHAHSVAGTENNLLGLGPYSKPQIEARIAQGETPIVTTEITPDGLEVRSAAGTNKTAMEQRQFFEQTKQPGNFVMAGPAAVPSSRPTNYLGAAGHAIFGAPMMGADGQWTQPGPGLVGDALGGMRDLVKQPSEIADADRYVTHPAVPGTWSDEDEARKQLNDAARAAHETAFGVNTSMNMMGAGTAFAPKGGELTTFGGVTAKGAPRAALERAQKLEALGTPEGLKHIIDDTAARTGSTLTEAQAKQALDEYIWKETGWGRGVDGRWRFEISDHDAAVAQGPTGNRHQYGPKGVPIPEEFAHDSLYEQYPALKDVRLSDDLESRFPGSSSAKAAHISGEVILNDTKIVAAEDARNVILHELQHEIQTNEGFALGGGFSHPEVKAAAEADLAQRLTVAREVEKRVMFDRDKYVMDHIAAGADPSSMTRLAQQFWREHPETWQEWDKVRDTIEQTPLVARDALRNAYERLAGEVEARNVQRRRDLTPEERRASPPWKTEDVPRDQQIIRREQKGAPALAQPADHLSPVHGNTKFDELPDAVKNDIAATLMEEVPAFGEYVNGDTALARQLIDGQVPSLTVHGGTAKASDFDISKRQVSEAAVRAYSKLSTKPPPVVVANGKVLEGGHRIALAASRGRSVDFVDISGLLKMDWEHWLNGGPARPSLSADFGELPPAKGTATNLTDGLKGFLDAADKITSERGAAKREQFQRQDAPVQQGGAGGAEGVAAAQDAAARAAGAVAPIEGLPVDPLIIRGQPYVPGPIESVHRVAEDYMRGTGRPYEPITSFEPVNRERAARIAKAFEDMPHNPKDPKVKASYDALIKETMAQLDALQKSGVKIEFIKHGQRDPYYESPRLAAQDLRDNNHLWVVPTDLGFGTGEYPGNPMLAKTKVKIDGRQLVANDAFRIVHDYFGHFKDGVGFRADGEENAWRSHSRMYSDLARPAMTTETRGQNSWLNYGEHGAKNRTAKSDTTIYAPQKIGLLPDWAVNEGAADFRAPTNSAGNAIFNAGVDAPPNRSVQTVADPRRMMFPGIYENPRRIAQEAAQRVAPEHPALKELWGVTRGDLDEMGKGRVGNEEPNLSLAKNPRGSLSAQNIQTPQNTQRLVDILGEAGRHPGLAHADAWYVMDPVYKRMVELFGPEEAPARYSKFNTMMGMASPGSDVMSEITRGTAAHQKAEQGHFSSFERFAGLPEDLRNKVKGFPADLAHVPGHPYHRTAQAEPMAKYLDTGSIQSEAPKVPLYVHASGVEQTGFQTKGPVGDAHFSRGVGLADTRKGPTDVGSSFSRPEYQTLQPWWQHEVAGGVGLESVPAQARLWTALGPKTGVQSALGQGKLELLSIQIAKAARRLGVPIDKARDLILSGKASAGMMAAVAAGLKATKDDGAPDPM